MWLGDNVVCHVWSFLDDSKDIPYSIFRFGKSKKERGTGYKWECSCPSFKFRGGKTCKHLITMRQEVKDKTILSDKRYVISDFGMIVLGL
ncbi:Zinc finger, SWIM-type [uncultured Caudovirales phage]|uniref:Zinc finger, SWIM-type n=1 Tax=uncultured Caudovirales phage TaxID=2100421 RepID=A0A6J5RR21_9CAUD|nr:Zinc finger, SWIM-type [uncultured Caudovirales phage]